MNLNIPILEPLLSCKSILIAGTGGGFDIFCGLPIYFELRKHRKEVHLANFSQSSIDKLKGVLRVTPTLIGATASQQHTLTYFPEHYLSQWFKEQRNEDVTIWCFGRTGVRPLLANYQALIDYLSVDAILLVDGGVDSLMHGDEVETGSITMDSISLAAVSQLQGLKVRITACLGFGAEREVTYAHVFENIAELTKENAFLGSCSLLKQMEAYQFYENAVLYVQNNPHQKPTIISSSVISAVRGEHGDYHLTSATDGSKLWISPLMPIYWFFDFAAVAQRNMLIPRIKDTETIFQAREIIRDYRRTVVMRPPTQVPLP
jgi:hypothetical protein